MSDINKEMKDYLENIPEAMRKKLSLVEIKSITDPFEQQVSALKKRVCNGLCSENLSAFASQVSDLQAQLETDRLGWLKQYELEEKENATLTEIIEGLRAENKELKNPWKPRSQLPDKTDLYFVRYPDDEDIGPTSMWYHLEHGWDEYPPETQFVDWMIIPPTEEPGNG